MHFSVCLNDVAAKPLVHFRCGSEPSAVTFSSFLKFNRFFLAVLIHIFIIFNWYTMVLMCYLIKLFCKILTCLLRNSLVYSLFFLQLLVIEQPLKIKKKLLRIKITSEAFRFQAIINLFCLYHSCEGIGTLSVAPFRCGAKFPCRGRSVIQKWRSWTLTQPEQYRFILDHLYH